MQHNDRMLARLRNVDNALDRLRAERSRLIARANQTERKHDTRRKILIGGAVLAAVAHEGVPAIRNNEELIAWLDEQLARPHDREVFELAPRTLLNDRGAR